MTGPCPSSRLTIGERVASSIASSSASSPSARGMLPQRRHDEVLRVRQPEGLEHGAVDRDDVARSGDEREAELVLEFQQIVARVHAPHSTRFVGTLIIMTRSDRDRPSLRERAQAGGSWYAYLNNRLIVSPARHPSAPTTPHPSRRAPSALVPCAKRRCRSTPSTDPARSRSCTPRRRPERGADPRAPVRGALDAPEPPRPRRGRCAARCRAP